MAKHRGELRQKGLKPAQIWVADTASDHIAASLAAACLAINAADQDTGDADFAGSGYAGRSRPVLIVQGDALAALDSVVVCPLTSVPHEESILRPLVQANTQSGLDVDSLVMTDKVVAVPRHKLGQVIVQVDPATLQKVVRGLGAVIGLGQGSSR